MLRRTNGGRQAGLGFDKSVRLKDGQKITFDLWPIPPSSNALYKHFVDKKTRTVRRVSTDKLLKYKKSCQEWSLCNPQKCKTANLYLRDEPHIKVTAYISLYHHNVYTKDGKVRKADVSNLGKALFDCLSEAIGIDDRHFTDVRLVKTITPDRYPEKCYVVLERCDILELVQETNQ